VLSPSRATWVGAKVLSRTKSAVSTGAIHVAFRSEIEPVVLDHFNFHWLRRRAARGRAGHGGLA
jgi:hypothetical protein